MSKVTLKNVFIVAVSFIVLGGGAYLATYISTQHKSERDDVQFRPKPKVELKPETKYRLRFVFAMPAETDKTAKEYRKRLQTVITRFCTSHKNFIVDLSIIEHGDMSKYLVSSGKRNELPDVAFLPTGLMGRYSRNQIPLDEFIQASTLDNMFPGALKGVGWKGMTLAIPVSFKSSVWVCRAATLSAWKLNPYHWGEGTLTTQDIVQSVGDSLPMLVQSAPDELGGKVVANPLTDVLSGKALAFAPVSYNLQKFLVELAENDPERLCFLPPPTKEENGRLSAQVSGYAAFANAKTRFKGHDHVKAAVTLTYYLAKHSQFIPAWCSQIPTDRTGEVSSMYRYMWSAAARMTCHGLRNRVK